MRHVSCHAFLHKEAFLGRKKKPKEASFAKDRLRGLFMVLFPANKIRAMMAHEEVPGSSDFQVMVCSVRLCPFFRHQLDKPNALNKA